MANFAALTLIYPKPNLIRPITSEDLDLLRIWKNDNKDAFFSRQVITFNEQLKWYCAYLDRDNDYMFAVLSPTGSIAGCMGVRFISHQKYWDVYNVILGDLRFKGSGLMSKALLELIEFAKQKDDLPIKLVVLSNNPAVGWYEKNGFTSESENSTSIIMCYDRKN